MGVWILKQAMGKEPINLRIGIGGGCWGEFQETGDGL